MILETERLLLREVDPAADAEFIYHLLNTPKFIKYIGDRGVRSAAAAAEFIESRYRQGYRDHGYGLYTVVYKADDAAAGICGFSRRKSLPGPDIGFAFVPDFEGMGFGFEAAAAALEYGRSRLGFSRVYAITTLDNHVSAKLLAKLGFDDRGETRSQKGESLRLFQIDL